MKRKLHSFIIGVVVFFMSISPAFAAGTAFALGLASTMADIALNYYIGTQEQRATALAQLNKFWADSGSGGSVHPTYVTYQSLSDLCLELNENGFPCLITTYPTTSSTNGDYCIRGNGNVVVPGVIPTTNNKYSIDGRILHTANGALYPILAKDPNQDSLAYKPIYDKLKDIYNYYTQTLTTKLNNIISYVDGLEGYVDGLEGYVDGLEGYVDGIEGKLDNIYSRLAYTNSSGVTGSVASFLYNIQNSANDIYSRLAYTNYDGVTGSVASFLYNIQNSNDHISASITSIIGYIDSVESTLNTISSRVNTTNTRLNTVNSNLTSISNKLDNISPSDPIDYSSDLQQLIDNTGDDLYITLYNTKTDGTAYQSQSYRPEVMSEFISYLNGKYAGRKILLNVLDRDGGAGVVSTTAIRYFNFAVLDTSGRLRISVVNQSGGTGLAYFSTYNHILFTENGSYIDDTTFLNTLVSAINNVSLDDTNIVNAIDRIYEWLDNADLATNATIVQVVQDYSADVDNSVDWASQILDLFRDIFVFDRPAPSFNGVLRYFSQLGSDPTE